MLRVQNGIAYAIMALYFVYACTGVLLAFVGAPSYTGVWMSFVLSVVAVLAIVGIAVSGRIRIAAWCATGYLAILAALVFSLLRHDTDFPEEVRWFVVPALLFALAVWLKDYASRSALRASNS